MRKILSLLCFVLVLVLCLPVLGEPVTEFALFPELTYLRVVCDVPYFNDVTAFDAAFCTDGSYWGVDEAREIVKGYYILLPDGTMRLDMDRCECLLTPMGNGCYAGAPEEIGGKCTLTPIAREAFDAAAEAAYVFLNDHAVRFDVSEWDYLVYVYVTRAEGIDLLVNQSWPEVAAAHLPQGTIIQILGNDGDDYLVESNGTRGFVTLTDDEFAEMPAMRARVVRSSAKDKGRTVNIRSTPDYGDNVIAEVPYGEIVDVWPIVSGEFTRVYYDHGPGWITSIRIEILDEE